MNSGGGHTNVSTLQEFFQTQASAADISSALTDSSVWFKVAMWIIMAIGAIAMAIWIARIAVDIVLIVTAGMGKGQGAASEGLARFGTGESQNYVNVWSYIKGNLLEIILVILLVFLLMSGYLFTLISIAIAGFGALLNKLLGLDIGGKLSALDAQAFAENVKSQRATSLRNQYDEQLASARQYSTQLYDMAKNGAVSDDPKFNEAKSHYTQAMVKANILAGELLNRGNVVEEFKLGEGYFQQHLRQSGDGVCNESFFVEDVIETFNVGGADAQVSCN